MEANRGNHCGTSFTRAIGTLPSVGVRGRNTSGVRSAGYHFYKSPPAVKSPAEMKKIFNLRDGESTQFMRVHRDDLQILAQRGVLAWLFYNGLILSLGRSRLILVLFGIFFGVGALAAIALVYWGLS
jgi:hypothetical protein